jgi:hypothetical protein
MSRSTDDTADGGAETVSSDGMATPYFMLVQMNNASLLEAYATLGISPKPEKISERKYPSGFSATKALTAIPFGKEDKAEHPGKIHAEGFDPIKEAERTTKGKAADAIALGQKVAARFSSNSGGGGDFGTLIQTAMAAASLPEIDFDPDIFSTGAAVLANSAGHSSATPDFAGSAPFSGMRVDYRPETAPDEVHHAGTRPGSRASTHFVVTAEKTAKSAVMLATLATRRHHMKGKK